MKNGGWILLALGAWWLMSKKQPNANTGATVTGNPGSLLPCYDAEGNIVDAGTSQYCPAGSFVTPPPSGWGSVGGGVTCLDAVGAAYNIPMGPCPQGMILPPYGAPPRPLDTGAGPQGLGVDSGLMGYWGGAGRL